MHGATEQEWNEYFKFLWMRAENKKIINQTMNTKASNVFKTLSHTFNCKYKHQSIQLWCYDNHQHLCFKVFCSEWLSKGYAIPSIESMRSWMELPKVYFTFYHIFFKSVMGEVKWSEALKGKNQKFGSSNTQAHALVLYTDKLAIEGSMEMKLLIDYNIEMEMLQWG